jgi:hypothetical protein
VEPPPVVAAEINFHNALAVRTGFLAAMLATLVMQVPLPVPIGFLWLLTGLMAAGFFAVYLYARRSGQSLNLRSGARMGWITGVFCFVIGTVTFTISVLLITAKGGLAQAFRELLAARAGSDPAMKQVFEMLQSPMGLGLLVLLTLVAQFVLFTLLPTLGGVLGAKVLERE